MDTAPSRGASFVRRIHKPRLIGCVLSSVFIYFAIEPLDPPGWLWVWMALNGFVWPFLSKWIALTRKDPYRAEYVNLMCDAVFCGFWIAAMHFNLLPSVLLLSMVTMNDVAAGGLRFLLVGTALRVLGIALGGALLGSGFHPGTTEPQVYGCLPMLLVYPLLVGLTSYRLAIRISQHKKAFEIISSLDSMTSLLNQKSWLEQLGREFFLCRAGKETATVALLDIDDFKAVNDQHGHLAGDAVILRLSHHLRTELRDIDVAGRYGGDEFCVIFRNLRAVRAREILERVRGQFSGMVEGRHGLPEVGLSIGVAEYSSLYASELDWLKAADAALYRAKQAGKNQVLVRDVG